MYNFSSLSSVVQKLDEVCKITSPEYDLVRAHQNRVKLLFMFFFQSMRVKLQPATSSNLPAYNPILPPSSITQIMLVANPRKVRVQYFIFTAL